MCDSQLHDEVDECAAPWYVKCIVHSLIDLTIITELRCQDPNCIMPGAPFATAANADLQLPQAPAAKHYKPSKTSVLRRNALSIDHTTPRRVGGSHRPTNMRIVHQSCNKSSWHTTLTHADRRTAALKQWETKRARFSQEEISAIARVGSMAALKKRSR